MGDVPAAPGRLAGGVDVPPGRHQKGRGNRPYHPGCPGGAAGLPSAGPGDLRGHPAHPWFWRIGRPGGRGPAAGRLLGRAGAQGGKAGGRVSGPGDHVRYERGLFCGLRQPDYRGAVRAGNLLRGDSAPGGPLSLRGLLSGRRDGGPGHGRAGHALLSLRLHPRRVVLWTGAGAGDCLRPAEYFGLLYLFRCPGGAGAAVSQPLSPGGGGERRCHGSHLNFGHKSLSGDRGGPHCPGH